MARSSFVPTTEGRGLTDAAAAAAAVPVDSGTFPVTSKSGADPGCNGLAADAARAGLPPLARSRTSLGTRSGVMSLGVMRAVSVEGLTTILAICSKPRTMRIAAVAPIKTCSLAMPAGRRTAVCVTNASCVVAASSLAACAARRAAAIRSDLPPGSGMTDSVAAPIRESDART